MQGYNGAIKSGKEILNRSKDSPNWVVFQPNIVIDAKLGEFTSLEFHVQINKDILGKHTFLLDICHTLQKKSTNS